MRKSIKGACVSVEVAWFNWSKAACAYLTYHSFEIGLLIESKARNKAKIRNWYNQVPHLIQDTKWESEKHTIKHHIKESQEVSLFPASDQKAIVNR